MIKAAVLGTTGYTGLLLVRLLSSHPEISEILPASSSSAGEKLTSLDPGIGNIIEEKLCFSKGRLFTIPEVLKQKPDVVFAALPHLESAGLCSPFFGKAVVIDLSADFRLKDREVFKLAYGTAPPREDLLPSAVYGLSEWYREEIKENDLIANPGCYPTAALLPLLPLLDSGIILGDVIINAISGISGAGRKAKLGYHFCERTENVSAYAPGKTHRHSWEIEAELRKCSSNAAVLFTPHLAPLKRGIAVTTAAELKHASGSDEIEAAYRDVYGKSPFISLKVESIPQTGDVWGSNRCDIGWHIDKNKLLLFSVIDNLMKGASGQAVQNMNIRFGLDESSGLSCHGAV